MLGGQFPVFCLHRVAGYPYTVLITSMRADSATFGECLPVPTQCAEGYPGAAHSVRTEGALFRAILNAEQ